ncbi:MAG: glutamine-hydrolyzing carbamoyl-phosphate synthase small subunit [Gemmatimonadota bacterium]
MAEAAILMLEDGRVFCGDAYGARGTIFGEVVFNTSMTGYQEVLTDPSYTGQIVTMTYPLIGNYGTNSEDRESDGPRVAGFAIHEAPPAHSNWRAEESLEAYLQRHGVVGIQGVDQRALTRHIRSAGAMRGAIAAGGTDEKALLDDIRGQPEMKGLDLACGVSTDERYVVPSVGPKRFDVLAFDFGVKAHSLKLLAERGCEITVLPAMTPPEEIVERDFDGLFISNGPGDPEAVGHVLQTIRTLADRNTPIFGICLGHQLIGRAFGATTYKLLYGHRGGNHPVRRLSDGTVEITAQNHGFAVKGDETEIPGAPELRPTHVNLNDRTIEGFEHRDKPIFSVQYHPESAPGPHDSRYLFDRMIDDMAKRETASARNA